MSTFLTNFSSQPQQVEQVTVLQMPLNNTHLFFFSFLEQHRQVWVPISSVIFVLFTGHHQVVKQNSTGKKRESEWGRESEMKRETETKKKHTNIQ